MHEHDGGHPSGIVVDTLTVLLRLEKSGEHQIDLSKDEFVDLRGEFRQCVGISSTSHEEPWEKARHFTAALTDGATDASSTA